MNYLDFCELITPYLVATIGVLLLLMAVAGLLLLVSLMWYWALCEWVSRFDATWKNTNSYRKFKNFVIESERQAQEEEV